MRKWTTAAAEFWYLLLPKRIAVSLTVANLAASVIINNFNYGRFLRDAIESAVNQTCPRTEVIVVDDGSTDNSREIIRSYGQRVIPVLKENGGQASAYNAGFRASHGDLVIFLDADDVLFPEAVSRVVEVCRPNVAKLQYRLQVLDGKGKPQNGYWPGINQPMPSGDLKGLVISHFNYLSPPGSGNAYSRHFLENVLPISESQWRICSDEPLVILAVFYGDVISINQPLGYYRIHGDNKWRGRGNPWLDKLALSVMSYVKLENSVLAKARELNLKAPLDLALRFVTHAEGRVALRILDPDRYPTPSESLPWLAWKAAQAIWKHSDLGLKTRIVHTVWLVLMLLTPLRLAKVWAEWLFAPAARRPRLLTRILGTPG